MHGHVIDARTGGYVIGRSHEEGGIKCVVEIEEGFQVVAEIEGSEFVINAHAATLYKEDIDVLNSDFDTSVNLEDPIQISKYTSVYNTSGTYEKVLWLPLNCYIVNRYATHKYFEVLEKLNFLSNPYRLPGLDTE
jgi:hypothetical protein